MDLIKEPWLPVTDLSGSKKKIALIDLLDDNVLDVAYPRADFQGAAWQFLIGLLQCTVAPENEDAWTDVWKRGIDGETWIQALNAIATAMRFGPQKPAFLQSVEPLDSENTSIAGLLIDAPGGNTLKLNKDHFVKRHTAEKMCPHCAVMALFTLQTNSPAGGAGYRVSLRGGGPLTTLVVPVEDDLIPLWKKLWLNILPEESPPQPAHYPLIFPWLAATKTSEKKGSIVTPENAHPLQAYWGMPRRIELDFTHTAAGNCDLCGEHHQELLLQMRGKNYGVQYDCWLHPLSPYRQALKDPAAGWLALKGQPGGLNYQDWLGLTLSGEDKFNRTIPARVVRARAGRKRLPATSLWCFAWDMDNAKARCWYQHRIPLIVTEHPDKFAAVVRRAIELASNALQLLKIQLKSAWFTAPSEAKIDFSITTIAFWQETEPAFRTLLDALIPDSSCAQPATRQAIRRWEMTLHTSLLEMFEREALTDVDCPADILLRQIRARRKLDEDYRKLKTRREILALAEEQKENGHA
ncbi:type I-E CRISPR-associated protein Cse1/CasA [Erwinia oleae]|uniref:type I-E CRISPR-associated protein Cse1/CasA n=1 Tax=Erwinia oleae TaxID=796334 RepID=UPI00055652E2|nr:type I-E CRISPR-associated protein Cse1/CasA [Erwinia oleae]